MPELLASRVYLYPKTGRFPTEVAQLELTAGNTIRLTAGETVIFDEPLTDIRVSGSGTSLTFATANGRRRVDFSPYSAAQRVVTVDDANREVFTTADAQTWAAKLAELGYPTRYWSSRKQGFLLAAFGCVLVVLAIWFATGRAV